MPHPAPPALPLRFLPAGDTAWLIELPDLPHTLALFEALQAARQTALQAAPPLSPLAALHTLAPAARTLLLEWDAHAASAASVAAAVRLAAQGLGARTAAPASAAARHVDIPVDYRGQDLEALAEHLGISRAELIERHTGCDYQAAFAGFAPGFVYLTGGHACFAQVPRLATPRTRVPAGSVALAGHFSAVYPKDSPGGWQLIGATPLAMWDLRRSEPALVQPGFRVRFADRAQPHRTISLPASAPASASAAEGTGTGASAGAGAGAKPSAGMAAGRPPSPGARTGAASAPAAPLAQLPRVAPDMPDALHAPAHLHVISPGLQTLFQDAGRRGMTGMGVSASGALDGAAMRAANRCVGNPPGAPVLENTLGGLQLRCAGHAVAAVTGAHARITVLTACGQRLHPGIGQPFALHDGDQLHLAAPDAGLRCYLALRGGLHVPPVLGSAACDTLAGIGPAPLQAGDAVAAGAAIAAAALRPVAHEPAAAEAAARLPRPGSEVWLTVRPGPRDDWFSPEALALLAGQRWQVTAQSNRVGMRLAGSAPLTRNAAHQGAELPSEGTPSGALQVPASGQPVLFLADHPLTGGYPVIAVLASGQLDLAAQVPPGAWLRFRVQPGPAQP